MFYQKQNFQGQLKVFTFQTWAKAGGCSKTSFNPSAHDKDKAYRRYVQVIKQDKSIWNPICAWSGPSACSAVEQL